MNQLQKLHDRAIAAYLGLAIGDALGATTEFMTPEEINLKYGIQADIIGGGWLNLKPGQVTDDTSMSLALGESILHNKGVIPLAVAQAFSNWLQAKPVDVGNTVRRGIVHFRYSGLPHSPANDASAGNGACMRTLPVAISTVFQPEIKVRIASRDQAHTTHNNVLSDEATECIVLMIQSSMVGASKSQLKTKWVEPLLRKFPVFEYENTKRVNPTGFIVETMQAVMQAFFSNDTFESSLVDIVNRGGDSDTTGAILGMLAGSYHGLSAIPDKWIESLDESIRQACEQQAIHLLELAMTSDKHSRNSVNMAANG